MACPEVGQAEAGVPALWGKGGDLLRECGGARAFLSTRLDLIGAVSPVLGRLTRACSPGKRSAGANRHISRRNRLE